MLVVFLPIFAANIETVFRYNFVAFLKTLITQTFCSMSNETRPELVTRVFSSSL